MVEPTTTHSVINDERWAILAPLLPAQGRRPGHQVDPRAALAAVVYVVTTSTAWADLPAVFGVAASTAQGQFWAYTAADLWGTLTDAATGTPHADWARTIADAATTRAAHRAPRRPDTRTLLANLPTETDAEPTDPPPTPPARQPPSPEQRYHPQPSAADYTQARDALNRHTDTLS